jgi:hypothetical protein
MMCRKKNILIGVAVAGLLGVRCTGPGPVSGTITQSGNGMVSGLVVDSGVPVGGARVLLIPSLFNPVADTPIPDSLVDTTGPSGTFRITASTRNDYNVEVEHGSGKNAIRCGIGFTKGATQNISPLMLASPGSVNIILHDATETGSSYVYIPGTSFFSLVQGDTVLLKHIPAGSIPEVRYYPVAAGGAGRIIGKNIRVVSGDTTTIIDYSLWKHARQLYLNTTASGADIAADVYNFPVLVRLTSEHIDFTRAKPGGEDVRFTKADGTPLAFEIERWDPVAGLAEVWVKVDTIRGNNGTQNIIVYWGNADAVDGSKSNGVFDTSAGFQAVWHFSGTGNNTETSVFDASANGYHGTPHAMDSTSIVEGAIGRARHFNGTSHYISVENSAAGKLDMPQNGDYSLSCWVYADTVDTLWHAIAGKGHEQYYLKLKCFGSGRATWEFVEFQDGKGWQYTEDSIPPAPGAKQWVYLTGVRTGSKQYLYVNGISVSESSPIMTGAYPRTTGDDFTIGRHARKVTIPYDEGWCYFNGKIDEVRVMNSVPDHDWIRLCYMNQKTVDALVEFR